MILKPNAEELALIAQEIGAKVMRGIVRYPGRGGGSALLPFWSHSRSYDRTLVGGEAVASRYPATFNRETPPHVPNRVIRWSNVFLIGS